MSIFQAVILGIVQGVTEFLPVSSSGHLVLFQHLFGLKEAELFFDVSVHMGTLTAVILFFRKEIRCLTAALFSFAGRVVRKNFSLKDAWADKDMKLILLIGIGSVPTAIIGLLFHKAAEQLFSSVFLVGCALMATGLILWGTRWTKQDGEGINGFSIRKALIIGFMQGVAILPGISRSGTTIATALFLGLERETAARYSFLLSIPAIVGAEILTLADMNPVTMPYLPILAGTLTAGVAGYLSLIMLVYIVKKGNMYMFAPYCWLVGTITLMWG
jgi:undecaprenyl-diphosphatase